MLLAFCGTRAVLHAPPELLGGKNAARHSQKTYRAISSYSSAWRPRASIGAGARPIPDRSSLTSSGCWTEGSDGWAPPWTAGSRRLGKFLRPNRSASPRPGREVGLLSPERQVSDLVETLSGCWSPTMALRCDGGAHSDRMRARRIGRRQRLQLLRLDDGCSAGISHCPHAEYRRTVLRDTPVSQPLTALCLVPWTGWSSVQNSRQRAGTWPTRLRYRDRKSAAACDRIHPRELPLPHLGRAV